MSAWCRSTIPTFPEQDGFGKSFKQFPTYRTSALTELLNIAIPFCPKGASNRTDQLLSLELNLISPATVNCCRLASALVTLIPTLFEVRVGFAAVHCDFSE